MKLTRLAAVFILSVIILPACKSTNGTNHTLTPPHQMPDSVSILPNLVVGLDGEVQVRRKGSEEFFRIGLGSQVQPGDILSVSNGEIAVFCGDEATWDQSPHTFFPGEYHGIPCLSSPSLAPMKYVTDLRGLENASELKIIPYIISPRSGWVLNDQPNIRWHTFPGIDDYKVSLESNDGQERSPVTSSGSELPYPDAWPPLQAGGADYKVIIHTEDSQSDEDKTSDQGFSLLTSEKRQQLYAQIDRLNEHQLLDETAITLLQAHLYLNYDLRSEAVELIRGLPGGGQIAAVQLLLGETYLFMDLFIEAEQAYQKALILAQRDDLPEARAAAYLGLGWSACGMTDLGVAQKYWGNARDHFNDLEQTKQSEVVSTLLSELEKECAP